MANRYIYSAGGHAREVKRLVEFQFSDDTVVLIDDYEKEGAVTFQEVLDSNRSTSNLPVCVAFADYRLRRAKVKLIQANGLPQYSVVAPTAVIGQNVEIGVGHIISDFSIITADAVIGDGFHCNLYSYVAHDCQIGDFVTLGPRVSINGRITVEDDVYIGTGATILPGKIGQPLTIGKGAVIGAHALVTKNVPENVTVIGCPARIVD